jgi:hypothetical protein
MKYRFRKHYTRDEARALLPEVRVWLSKLVDLRDRINRFDARLASLLAQGDDVGGDTVNGWLRALIDFRSTLAEFQERQIQVKDIDRGLVDFPSIFKGKEVFLCWEQGEEDIEYWHELDGGFSGREPLF